MVAITGVCSGREEREDVQSPSTREPKRRGNHSHMCVARSAVSLRRFCCNGIRHNGKEVVITKPVATLPEHSVAVVLLTQVLVRLRKCKRREKSRWVD